MMRDYEEEWWNIMGAIADSYMLATDKEIMEECGDDDPESTRKALFDAIDRHKALTEAESEPTLDT